MISHLPIFMKEMLSGKIRLFLTILAITWATTTITFLLAVGEGLRITFSKSSDSIGKSFVVIRGGQTSSLQQGQLPNQSVHLTLEDLDKLAQGIPNIQILLEYHFNANISHQRQLFQKDVNAVYPNYASLRNLTIQSGGRFIDNLDIQENRRVIVIGTEFSEEIYKTKLSNQLLGKNIIIDKKPYKIIGVLAEKPLMGLYQMPDNYLAWIPASTYMVEKKPQDINSLLIFPKQPIPITALTRQFVRLIALNHHLDPIDQNILQIVNVEKMQNETKKTLQGTEIFLGFVGIINLVVAGVGIANVMYISVRRATREIGIRMAMGARSWQILWRYIAEALMATFVGGFIGMSVSYSLVLAINQIPLHNEMFKYIGKPTPIFSWTVIGTVITALGIVGMLAGFFPAKRAADIDPAQALRHE